MEHHDWYPDWRHEAYHQLQDKNAQLHAKFRLDDWPRWDYDVGVGTLIFSEDGIPRVTAEIQIAGTTSVKAGNWLWAWGNSDWPAARVTDAELVRAYGEKHGICQLTHKFVQGKNLNALGWELAAVMARVTNALGVYRPPREEGGGLFLTYKSMDW